MSKYITISFTIIFFIVGTGFGFLISPEYAMTQYEKLSMIDLGKPDKYVDLRYINAMIAHHKGAIKLAENVKDKSQRKDINDLSVEILANEPKAIDELYKWKKDWFNDTTIVESKIVPNLGTFDDKLDLRFLNALINHHEEGIEMTKEIMTKSIKNEILNNATGVNNFLSNGIEGLSNWRTKWYEIN